MTDSFQTASLDQLERTDGWAPIRRHFGIKAFGINAWTAHEADATLIPYHAEEPSGHEELYIVTAGHATFRVGIQDIDAPAGTIVFVRDPLMQRGAVAKEPETTVISVGAKPGEAFVARTWETNPDVLPLFEKGEHEEAKRVLLEALDEYEDTAILHYNLACCEAQLGDTEAAIEYFRTAVGMQPQLAGYAAGDSDLEPIKADPRYAEIATVS
jgi:tetratricopeptide (TPR) repeat protein